MTTRLPEPGAQDALYVIDLSGYVFRAYHAIAPLSSPHGEPTHATYGTMNMLMRLVNDRQPYLLGVAMDSKTPSFRRDVDARYKANRPPPPEDLSIQMERTRQLVEAHGIHVWQQDGFEADDLIASVALRAQGHGLRVVIVSADKDLTQLVNARVLMWDTMRNTVYGPEEVEAKYGVPPGKMRDLLALMGDTSDNIPGVPSVGQKTAAKLLSQYESVADVYCHLDDLKAGKVRDAMMSHKDQAFLSLQLVTLRSDLAVEMHLDRLRFGAHVQVDRLTDLYAELGFSRLLESLRRVALTTTAEQDTRYQIVRTPEELAHVVRACQDAGRVAIDTETTSTDAMRAGLVGLSLSHAAQQAFYVPVAHHCPEGEEQLPLATVREALDSVLASPAVKKVGHNLKYDETVLRRHGFEPIRSVDFDTMIASYLLDPEATHGLKDLAARELGVHMTTFDQVLGSGVETFAEVSIEKARDYACADADMTLRISDLVRPRVEERGMRALLHDVELPLSQVLVDMEMAGVLVDCEHLVRLSSDMQEQLEALEALAKRQAGRDFHVGSPRQLETILFDELGLKAAKRTKTGRSTDASVLEMLADAHPLVRTILEHRMVAKLKNTYVDSLPRLVHPETGRVHTHYNQTVAATGRLSSSDPNLQNIPVRTESGRAIRSAFVAPKGCVLLSADYSQIELRVLAHLANDDVLIDAFRKQEDVHTRTAMEIFGLTREAVTSEHRRQAKTINFGVIYGMGEVSLAKRLGITRSEASRFISTYFERYRGVREFMEASVREARRAKAVRTVLGRVRHLPDLDSPNPRLRAQAERIAGNTPIQGSAADLLKLAMVRLSSPVVPGARMLLTVHDELVFEIPESSLSEAAHRIRDAMENVMDLRVPLVVDMGTGKTWADAH